MEKISIIVPVYNVKKYLKKLVNSIIAQSFTDWELILVDDGSTDKVISVIHDFEKKDSRIKSVIRPQNGGAAVARKSGLKVARGEYICFFDADDWLEKDALDVLYQCAADNNADIVCCGYFEEYASVSMRRHFEKRKMTIYSGIEAVKQLLRRKNVLPHPWNKLYRKEVLSSNFFLNKKSMGEDYCMVLGALLHSKKIVQIDDALYHYILRKGSTLDIGFNDFYANGFYTYKRIENDLLHYFPTMKKQIIGYHMVEEMAIMAAMFKNEVYDRTILNHIISDMKQNFGSVICNKDVALQFKMSAVCICLDYRLLRKGYLLLYRHRNSIKVK